MRRSVRKEELTVLTDSDFTIEPFCLLWSKSTSNEGFIDTLGFAPRTPSPPVAVLPGVQLLTKCPLPFMAPAPCTNCEFAAGWPLEQFNIGPITCQALFQFRGIALSWADNAKLAFGTNEASSSIQIWDGFRNQPLLVITDIHFWVSFRFTAIDYVSYKLIESECKLSVGFVDKLKGIEAGGFSELYLSSLFTPKTEMDFEIYVAFDKQTESGVETTL
jgi:hypothetical protein